MITCALHPLACATSALASVPWGWLLAGLIAGMLLGAALKWPGVLALLTMGVAMLFMFREKASADAHEHVEGRDAKPSHPDPPRRKGETAADAYERHMRENR